MSDIKEIIEKLEYFRDERDWSQFHNPKDLALAISIESGELLENYLWKDAKNADKEKVAEELADIISYTFLLAKKYDFDIKKIVLDKIEKNAKKYPIEKSKGTAKKYDEL
jgi:NTP pyrophosphatase (non-canonical NTP hydrolase)